MILVWFVRDGRSGNVYDKEDEPYGKGRRRQIEEVP